MAEQGEKLGTLATALAQGERLLGRDAALAETQAREILKVVPDNPDAVRLLAAALRTQGNIEAARDAIEPVAINHRTHPRLQFEMAMVLAEQGDDDAAIKALRRAVRHDRNMADAWLALADRLRLKGDAKGSDEAYAEQIRASTRDPQLLTAAAALCENKLAIAERLLRAHLKEQPTDVAAIRMLAETGSRLGQYADAEKLLARCIELAPGFAPARHNYAVVLHRQGKFGDALVETELLLADEPNDPNYRALQAALLGRIGDFTRAISAYEILLARYPNQARGWLSFGHALRAVGRQAESVDAYRRSIALVPSFGEAYWSLANLKTFRFEPSEIAAMRTQLAHSDLAAEDRLHLNFALAKALEDQGDFSESFENYAKANAIRRRATGYNPDLVAENVARAKALFTRSFMAAHNDVGSDAPDPIFIVGLPRSGSTPVEQILSSHSAIEGTMELSDIIAMAQRLGGRQKRAERSAYPDVLAEIPREEFAALGNEYIERTRIQRHTSRAYFIDKMPNNFMHVGFIHLILPRSEDHRRQASSACLLASRSFSSSTSARGQELHLQPRGHRPVLCRLCRPDGAL